MRERPELLGVLPIEDLGDRVGSGDAVLALTSSCVARGLPPDMVAFIANVIGAQAVQIMGNRTSVGRVATLKFIETLLK